MTLHGVPVRIVKGRVELNCWVKDEPLSDWQAAAVPAMTRVAGPPPVDCPIRTGLTNPGRRTGIFNMKAWDKMAVKAMMKILTEDKGMVEALRYDMLPQVGPSSCQLQPPLAESGFRSRRTL